MPSIALGRLEPVDLRAAWLNEARDFTPWLALPENLALLGEALDMDIELERSEQKVGRFSADLLCKDIGGSDQWVLVENQLERTDHGHLGQLLTYAAGLKAVTIVWIAPKFTEEHRAALDWLNEITSEDVRFFGLEIELWRIGEGPAAPKFNVVAQPNDWSKTVAQNARAIESGELSDIRLLQLEYWTALNAALDVAHGPVSGHRKAAARSWATFSLGRSGFQLSAAIHIQKRWVRTELYITGPHAKAYFGQLETMKDAIEAEIGYGLDWEPRNAAKDCRISVSLPDVNPEDRSDWPRQHEWVAERLNEFYRTFASRIKALRS